MLDPTNEVHPTRDHPPDKPFKESLPPAKEAKVHPSKAGEENARIFFIGTATTILYVSFSIIHIHDQASSN